MTISDNKIIRAGVIGSPICQSRSPLIHRYWLEAHKIAGRYDALEVIPDDVDDFFANLKNSDFAGLNVTIPHKEIAFNAVDRVDEAANLIGAVNTIWREGDALLGGNTDWIGFSNNLGDFVPEWKSETRTALVLGAGGAARAVIFALLQANVEKIILANRTLARAQKLKTVFGPKILPINLLEANDYVKDVDLLINTTSLGMAGEPPLPVAIKTAKPSMIVTDIVYKPLETPILTEAKNNGFRTVDGLGMLLHQAAPGFKKWFGKKVTVTDELRQLIIKDLGN